MTQQSLQTKADDLLKEIKDSTAEFEKITSGLIQDLKKEVTEGEKGIGNFSKEVIAFEKKNQDRLDQVVLDYFEE